MKSGYEIERKFLLDAKCVPIPMSDSIHIEQYYISTSPEIRLRKEIVGYSGGYDYFLTVKIPHENMLVRTEVELETTEHEFYKNLDET